MDKSKPEVDRPGKPAIKRESSDSIDIKWDAVTSFCIGDVYQVRYENTTSRKWNCQNFEINSGTIVGLEPSTSYTFKVRLVKENGEESKYGETSEEVKTKKEPIPGKPSVQHVLADSVAMVWMHVDTFCKGDEYEVHVENIETQEIIWQKFKVNCATIEDLQPDSQYVFKVRLVSQNGKVSKYSENSDMVTTCSTFASKLIRLQSPVKTCYKGNALYELPLVEVPHAKNKDALSIKYDIGPRHKIIIEKTIMLLGATGTGKSTFVDSLANYVLGVRLTDPYRFTVMREDERKKQRNKAISQTDWIKSYTFNPQEGNRLYYTLNVIDTPGFGDTRGRERDKDIVGQIRSLFMADGQKGARTIDAVCFFVKASDCRLTEAQSYIFNEIQSLFAKDIKKNICLLITFADGSYPEVMHAVKEYKLLHGERFSFNNLPPYSDPKDSTVSMFWKMSYSNYKALFKHVDMLDSQSLKLSKEVLKERQLLELTYQNVHAYINKSMSIMHSIKKEMTLLEEKIDEIERNKNFTYTVTEIKDIRVDLPQNERATICKACKTTCHINCSSVFQRFPRTCRVINLFTGYCSQCKCHSESHKTKGYRFDTCDVKVTRTYEDRRKRFEDATEKLMTVNDVVKKMKGEQAANIAKTKEMLYAMLQCNNRLNEIALRPAKLSICEQIEQLIKAERTEGRQGFRIRIEQLTQFLEEARSLEGSQNTAFRSDY